MEKPTKRKLKKEFAEQLVVADNDTAFEPILKLPERVSFNALVSLFYDKNPLLKWRAVSAAGMVVDQAARKDRESARVLMRRLMWTLNDESGGIGWGAPEAMGDIMARNQKIAEEYHTILLSYIIEDQNYLEHEMLQRGLLWGVGRLSHARPEMIKPFAGHLNPFLASKDSIHRGLAVWTVLPLHQEINFSYLTRLKNDVSKFFLYDKDEYTIKEKSIAKLAGQALAEDEA